MLTIVMSTLLLSLLLWLLLLVVVVIVKRVQELRKIDAVDNEQRSVSFPSFNSPSHQTFSFCFLVHIISPTIFSDSKCKPRCIVVYIRRYNRRRLLVDALSPVNHKGLHQGWTQTLHYFQVIHFTSHFTTAHGSKLFFYSLFIFSGHSAREHTFNRVTYFTLRASTGTDVSHSQHRKK